MCVAPYWLLQNLRGIFVWRTKSFTCPVAMIERYFSKTSMESSDQQFLFQPIQWTKRGKSLKGSGKISYSCLRDLVFQLET